jgi:hypothetical protein
MKMTSTSFHVRHDLTPVVAREALLLLRLAPTVNGQALLERARERDLELCRRRSAEKVLASLRDLGLVARQPRREPGMVALTDLGGLMADVAMRDPFLFAELVHLRHWWLWATDRGGPPFAWAYRTVATILWESAPAPVEPDRLVIAVIAAAENDLGIRDVSFSTSSVLGILHWLRALSPTCIVTGMFRRRAACSPEALVLALEAIRCGAGNGGAALLLNPDVRRLACCALLIEEASFDEVLAQAEEAQAIIHLSAAAGEAVIVRPSALTRLVSAEAA